MNALTILRLLRGPARKFFFGKLLSKLTGKKHIALPKSSADPRVVLEQSRMHQWVGGISSDELIHWLRTYPTHDPRMWAVGMDVGIRLHNLCIGTYRSKGHIALHHEAIYLHADWLWKHLETAGGMATSHLLGGLLGMVSAAAYVQDDTLSKRGVQCAAMFHKQIQKQILPDGMSFEASTAYHRHVADILVWATASMAQHVGMVRQLDTTWWQTLDKVMNTLHILEQAGMPLIGDNDDGMAIKAQASYPGTPSTVALWDAYTRVLQRPTPEPPAIPSHTAFEHFGLDIWFRKRYVLTARCGQPGQYDKGGHAHNDANSMTLSVNNEPLIIDSGSFVYTADPNRRNDDRSTQSHSTVMSTKEQRTWPEGIDGLFWLFPSKPYPTVLERGSNKWHGRVVHQNIRGWEHERAISVEDTIIRITDTVGPSMQSPTMILIVAPNVVVERQYDHLWLHGKQSTVLITGIPNTARIEDCVTAPAYQISQDCKRIVVPISGGRLSWTITLP